MPDDARSALGAPTAFFQTHEKRLAATSGIGPVLDLACGHGRHSIAAADLGLDVLAIDRNGEALDSLGHIQPRNQGKIRTLRVDLESTSPPSLEPLSFGAVLVFRYLHRPLVGWIEGLIGAGGILLYETFTRNQTELGWGPSREDFLLKPAELPTLFPNLELEVYEEGPSQDERAPRTARLLASRRG
jgi:SAM-dependent methyltransferase